MPLRRTKSYVSPSFDWVHDSARLGVFQPAGIGFTSASWSAYRNMNGVMMPSVSAGSSQRDASVMCTPQVTVPSGAAEAGRGDPKNVRQVMNARPSGMMTRLMGTSE